jgi:hypothetical protein
MLTKYLFSRRRRALLLASCLVALTRTVSAQQASMSSELSAPPALVSLRPITEIEPASKPATPPAPTASRVATARSEESSGIGPLRVPHNDTESTDTPATSIRLASAADEAAMTGPLPVSHTDTLSSDRTIRLTSAASDESSVLGPLPVPHSDPDAAPVSAPDSATGTQVAANDFAANSPASARASDSASAPSTPPPSPNATINLINLMVKRNLISKDDADGLIKQAQEEADVARAQTATAQAKAERALDAQQTASTPAPAAGPSSSGDDEVRIAYVPDVVKKQITEQVTQNVMEQTREEHLADTIAASQVPDWVKRFHVTGDVRLRYEDDMFPSGNAIGNFTNFNAINTSSSGFNVNTSSPQLPQYNVDQDRNRFRLRARIGAGIDLGENFTAGMRIATGSDDNPVTENQTLGGANSGQGGNFAKYQIWLDRAFIRYDVGNPEDKNLVLTVGRFDNPFFSTSMLWADDLGFDGAMFKGTYHVTPGLTPFLTGGAFPVFNTDLNFSSNQSAKFQSEDKYLFAVQGGTRWTINKDFSVIGAGAFYDFENIQGKVSDPILNAGINAGNTDDSRPSFAQNGNTYIALRDYQDPTAVSGVTVENQYYGLASQFRVAALTGQLDFSRFDPFHMSLTGEFIKNVAFDRNSIVNGGPVSNPGPQNNTTSSDATSFDGGDMGYLVRLDMGKPVLQQLWDWNVRLSYRYVETDATVDAFTDSDFGGSLTGTNLKGYTVGGNLALSSRVWAGLRWMSADNISGPTFRNDLIQFDLNAKF